MTKASGSISVSGMVIAILALIGVLTAMGAESERDSQQEDSAFANEVSRVVADISELWGEDVSLPELPTSALSAESVTISGYTLLLKSTHGDDKPFRDPKHGMTTLRFARWSDGRISFKVLARTSPPESETSVLLSPAIGILDGEYVNKARANEGVDSVNFGSFTLGITSPSEVQTVLGEPDEVKARESPRGAFRTVLTYDYTKKAKGYVGLTRLTYFFDVAGKLVLAHIYFDWP